MDSTIAMPLGPDDPQEIGQFTIIGLLGAGGMGEVYLGTAEGGYAAVKQIRPRLVSCERFKREVGILYRVPADVAPGVLAHDSTAARPWFAADYVPGLTVDEALGLHGPLPSDALWLLLAETAAHLRTVHEAGIVHRDLKPANVMLVHNGVRLIDFGIARAADQARLTRSGESYGTPGFTAPEQKAGHPDVASPADVYSLGALLLYAASGHEPGPGLDIEPARRADAGLAAVVASCLATDPGERPTAAGLVESARDHVLATDPSWPPQVTARIAARREFAATPAGKIETLPPPSPPEPRESSPPRHPSRFGEPWFYPAAEKLAADVRKQWEREERLRQVHDPYPLPVRFTVADAEAGLFDHWANIRGTGRGTDPGPLALSGDLAGITAVYRSVPSRRLVVLGEAGSGKTILALRFVLDCLDNYAPGDRIPVIFSLGSWDPAALSLRDWMCRQLARDHNALGQTAADGGNLAGELIDNHHVLPVLDGFDEIAPGLQGAALAALNYYAGPLMLTSRPAEYARAVREHDVLTAAACVELQALELDYIDDYLTRASRPAPGAALRTVWEPVLTELRKERHTPGAANVAAVFTTPLMVALARTIYSDAPGHDPRELLDTGRFGTAEAVREHLLAQFVPAAYRERPAALVSRAARPRRPRRWNHDRAERWLGYLAWHMEEQGQHDLAWWELGTVMSLLSRMLVVGTVVGFVTGIVAGLVYGSAAALTAGLGTGLRTAVVDGVMNGLGVGVTFGLLHGFATKLMVGLVFEPSYVRIQLRGATISKLRKNFLPRVGAGLVGGLLFGVVWAVGNALGSAAFSISFGPAPGDDVAIGTGLGAMVGLVIAIAAGLESVSEKENAAHPAILLNKSRASAIIQLLAVGLVLGVGSGFVLGPVHGLVAGLMIPIGLGTTRCWGRWVVLSRVWLPLTGKVPSSIIAFLEDAHHRGVLRQTGAVYQFRHARIQAQLAERFEQHRREAAA